MKIIHRNDSLHTARSRDAALHRLGRINRWLIGGSVVLTGVLTDVAANAFSGHSKSSAATSGSSSAKRRHHHHTLKPPAQAPKTTETHQAAPAPETPAPTEEAPAPREEAPAPREEAPAPVEETQAPEAAAPEPEVREEAPAPEEPVVSGGS
jgi:type IV secretory pathway VirB10-like protein